MPEHATFSAARSGASHLRLSGDRLVPQARVRFEQWRYARDHAHRRGRPGAPSRRSVVAIVGVHDSGQHLIGTLISFSGHADVATKGQCVARRADRCCGRGGRQCGRSATNMNSCPGARNSEQLALVRQRHEKRSNTLRGPRCAAAGDTYDQRLAAAYHLHAVAGHVLALSRRRRGRAVSIEVVPQGLRRARQRLKLGLVCRVSSRSTWPADVLGVRRLGERERVARRAAGARASELFATARPAVPAGALPCRRWPARVFLADLPVIGNSPAAGSAALRRPRAASTLRRPCMGCTDLYPCNTVQDCRHALAPASLCHVEIIPNRACSRGTMREGRLRRGDHRRRRPRSRRAYYLAAITASRRRVLERGVLVAQHRRNTTSPLELLTPEACSSTTRACDSAGSCAGLRT